jgi:DNA polymerase-3 subunit epsilon
MWGKNVRAVVSEMTWASLRWVYGASMSRPRRLEIDFPEELLAPRRTYSPHFYCSICNDKRRSLELHEEWSFDDDAKVQRLDEFLAICPRCHLAKHIGRAQQIGKYEEALDHLARVNDLSKDEAIDLANEAMARWRERSQYEYQLDLSHLETIIPKTRIHLDWIGSHRSWFGSRLHSTFWAKEILDSDALIIDTETTGLPDRIPNVEIIELSMINTRGEVVFDSLFRPSIPIPNAEIHNITDKMVRNSPTIAEKWEEICDLMRGRTIVTYNAKFDREVFHTTCDLYGLTLPDDWQWHCAMQAWWTYNEFPYTSLPGSQHRALGDARAALGLIQEMSASADDPFWGSRIETVE